MNYERIVVFLLAEIHISHYSGACISYSKSFILVDLEVKQIACFMANVPNEADIHKVIGIMGNYNCIPYKPY